MSSRSGMEQMAKEVLAAYNAGDWDTELKHFSENAIMLLPRSETESYEVKGTKALKEMYVSFSSVNNPDVKATEVVIQGFVWCMQEMGVVWKRIDQMTAGGTKEFWGFSSVTADDDNKVTYWKDFFSYSIP